MRQADHRLSVEAAVLEEAGFEVVAIKGTEAPSLPAICETPLDDIRRVLRQVADSGRYYHYAESAFQVGGDVVDAAVVVAEGRELTFALIVDGHALLVADDLDPGVLDRGQRVGADRQAGDAAGQPSSRNRRSLPGR